MAKQRSLWVTFNRGIVSVLGRHRVDIDRIRMSAASMTNWMSRVLGSMMLRPGTGYIDTTNSNARAKLLSFQFTVDDTAQIEVTEAAIRIREDDVLVTRPAVTATITNPDFDTDITTGWTNADDGGATSSWQTGGYLGLAGSGDSSARLRQQVTVLGSETTTTHSLVIEIVRGPVKFRVGTTAGMEDIFDEQLLAEGTHSIAFVPGATSFWIELAAERQYRALVSSCDIGTAGAVALTSPYTTAELRNIRYWQSGDVIFMSGAGASQYNIERRDNSSWSIVKFLPEDGPFRGINATNITVAPAAIIGDTTLTASKGIFKSGHVGSLFRVDSIGQTVTKDIPADDPAGTWTDTIRVTGEDDAREFSIVIANLTGTGSTVHLQYASTEIGPWSDAGSGGSPWTADVTTTKTDSRDNQIIYWRLGMKTGNWSSGTTTVTLSYASGSITGIARIDAFTSETVVGAHVLKSFGALTGTSDWYEGEWSDYRGHPSATGGYEQRNWYAGRDKINGSESDQYYNYDKDIEGASGPIQRQIGSGPIRIIHWIVGLGRLLIGTTQNSANVAAVEINANNMLSGRSTSFDEPLTPANFNLKTINSKAIFVDRSTIRLMELAISAQQGGAFDDYSAIDLSVLTPDLNRSGIIHIAAQEKPDVRIHCVRTDGTVGILVYDRAEDVASWQEYETDGLVEDVSVLPGGEEDQVYYLIRRTINGSTKRYIEKWALEYEAQGGLTSKIADSFIAYDGASTTAISGLDHLEGEMVVVWADGKDVTEYDSSDTHTGPTVSSGAITLATAAAKVVVGLPYTGSFKSNTLSSIDGIAPGDVRRIEGIQFSLYKTHHLGLKYGPDFTRLDDLPQVVDGADVVVDSIFGETEDMSDKDFAFGGVWAPDSRLCLEAKAPRPATVLGCKVTLDTHER